ncbi:dihydrofolate reductase [Streptomyces sp. A7024]|uniref:Dihydrofolate reductase n=1 Tax=Streptomyces coryli TaxID=1128680 RepID=A0A6G4UEH5_9ACTN|nr:dihydrofolate reductase family protein [Streptomyces coryli]NGN70206.1 dihydrofolate reductase [Streptomyces coryli]
MDHPFSSHVFIGTSVDGFIARTDGDIEWLVSRGEAAGDYGYDAFAAGIDTVVMGRGTYEAVVAGGWWAYDGKHVAVLSTRLDADADPRITVYRSLEELISGLAERGTKNVYADGGQVIQTFLRAGLIDTITISQVPVLIGSGIPLFGPLTEDISLTHRETKVLGAGMIQTSYEVAR